MSQILPNIKKKLYDSNMKVLMISGDTQEKKKKNGPFLTTLQGLSRYWETIVVFCPAVLQDIELDLFPNVKMVAIKSPKKKWFYRRYLLPLFKRYKFDLMVSHDYGLMLNGLNTAYLSRLQNIPWISELHHIEGYPVAATFKDFVYRWIGWAFVRRFWNNVLFFRLVNRGDLYKKLLTLGVPQEKIKVIPAILIDQEVFYADPAIPKTFDFVFCGRLVPNKGVFQILRVFKALSLEFPCLTLCLVGEGPQKEAVDRMLKNESISNVTQIGWVKNSTDLGDIYRKSKIYICASTAEGGPRTPIEALNCGCFVVSTRVGIMPEVITHPDLGVLYDGTDQGLKDALIQLLRRSQDGPLYHGLMRGAVAERFHALTVLKTYAEIYAQALITFSSNK